MLVIAIILVTYTGRRPHAQVYLEYLKNIDRSNIITKITIPTYVGKRVRS